MPSPTCGDLLEALKREVTSIEARDFFLDWAESRTAEVMAEYLATPLTEDLAVGLAYEVAEYFRPALQSCSNRQASYGYLACAVKLITAINLQTIKLGVRLNSLDYFGSANSPLDLLLSIGEDGESSGTVDKKTAALLMEIFLNQNQTPAPSKPTKPNYFSSN